jgi:hypothetical protein
MNPYESGQAVPVASPAPAVSKARLYTGYALSILPALLLLMGGVMNILKTEVAVNGAKEMGYTESSLLPLGIATVVSVVLLIIPRSALLGALLVTGYLGGAVNTHVHHQDDLIKILIPVIFASVIWIGLVLRSPKLNSLMPWGEGL